MGKKMYQIEEIRNKILQGDALVELMKMPDESIDCIIADPPYKISQEGKVIYRGIKKYKWERNTNIGFDFGKWDRQWESDENFFEWVELWFKECVRVMKKKAWIYIFFDKQKTGIFDLYLAPKYKIKARIIYIWVKTNPVPSFRKVNWNSGTEHIWVGSKGDSKLKNFFDQKLMSNYFLSPNASAYSKTEHPTEKPETLIARLVRVNTNEGDTVLDLFSGSGTTAVVCKRLKRNFCSVEISEEYIKIAKKRLLQNYFKF